MVSGGRTLHTPFGPVPVPAHSELLTSLARGEYDAIGFDLDHTLLRYRLGPLVEHIFVSLRDHLVRAEGLPRELLDVPWSEVSRFAGKAVVMDLGSGEVVKLSANGDVSLAIGPDGAPRDAVAVAARHPDGVVQGFDPERFVFTRSTRFAELPSYFDIPLAALWVACHRVGAQNWAPVGDDNDNDNSNDIDNNNGDAAETEGTSAPKRRTEPRAHPDAVSDEDRRHALYAAMIRALVANYCGAGDGRLPRGSPFFAAILSDPGRFLVPWSEVEVEWLSTLRERHGCTPFIVSNALAEFVEFALDWCTAGVRCETSWRDWFSFVIAEGAKPAFFDDDDATVGGVARPFRAFVQGGSAGSSARVADGDIVPSPHPWCGFTLRGGNARAVEKAIAADVVGRGSGGEGGGGCVDGKGKDPNPRIIYVGDHLRNDVWACKHLRAWATIAVVEEVAMEHMMDSVVVDVQTPAWDYERIWGSVFLAERQGDAAIVRPEFSASPPAVGVDAAHISMSAALMANHADLVIPTVYDLVHQFVRTVQEDKIGDGDD